MNALQELGEANLQTYSSEDRQTYGKTGTVVDLATLTLGSSKGREVRLPRPKKVRGRLRLSMIRVQLHCPCKEELVAAATLVSCLLGLRLWTKESGSGRVTWSCGDIN